MYAQFFSICANGGTKFAIRLLENHSQPLYPLYPRTLTTNLNHNHHNRSSSNSSNNSKKQTHP